MTDLRQAAEMALEELEAQAELILALNYHHSGAYLAIEALRQALAQPEKSQTAGYAKKIEQLIKERDELRQALAITNPDRDSSYAGVRMWIGDKEIEYWVSKVCIEQEMIEDMSMKFAANSCLKALKESKHD